MRKTTTLLLVTLLVGIVSAYPGAMAVQNQDVTPFIFGVTSEPSSFDPLGAYDTTSGNVILNTLEGLYNYDYQTVGSSSIRPQLASDFGTWNDDNTVLTIPLRQDVYFWDGTKLTADDIVWNFNRLTRLAESQVCEHASLWLLADGTPMLESIKATGTYEVQMTLVKYTNAWEKLLPFWGATIIKPNDDYANATISLDELNLIIGTGPFKLDYYKAGETTTLLRNDNYYQGKADIAKIEFIKYADGATLTTAMLAGEVTVVRGISSATFEQAFQDPNLNVQLLRGSCLYYFNMNVNTLPWEVRKAAQFAWNYSYLPSTFRNAPSANNPIPVGMEGYNPDIPGLPYTDLAKARNYMLTSTVPEIVAGIAANSLTASSTDEEWVLAAQGDTPVYTANFTSYDTSFYGYLKNFLQFVGINLEDNMVGDWPTFLSYMNGADAPSITQFVMGGWCPDYFDPVNMMEPIFSGSGSSNWCALNNATINANLDALHYMQDGSNEKLAALDEVVSQIIVEQAAAMYVEAGADLICWNTNPKTGIVQGAECLLNARGDKYFYPIDFAPTEGNPYGIVYDPSAGSSGATVPGYNLGLLVVATLGASAFLLFRKRN